MSEAVLVHKIIKAVKAKYPRAYVVKLSDRFTRGLPDLLIVFPRAKTLWGGLLFVEAKAPGGRISKIQEAEHHKIRTANGDILVAKTVERVMEELKCLEAIP